MESESEAEPLCAPATRDRPFLPLRCVQGLQVSRHSNRRAQDHLRWHTFRLRLEHRDATKQQVRKTEEEEEGAVFGSGFTLATSPDRHWFPQFTATA